MKFTARVTMNVESVLRNEAWEVGGLAGGMTCETG